MTKPKTGASAPEDQQPDAAAAPQIEDQPTAEEQPTRGGSYIRNADGSLTREEEA